jgi:hypothetical protein
MKHESEPSRTTTGEVPTSPSSTLDPPLNVLQLNETTCAVNEISTPITETECLSKNHELGLDDFAQLVASSWDEDMINSEERGKDTDSSVESNDIICVECFSST